MDMAFLHRANRLFGPSEPARLDHAMLLATLAAQQSSSETARLLRKRGAEEEGASDVEGEPLVELLLAGPGWRDAARAQQGCFNRAGSKRGVNDR